MIEKIKLTRSGLTADVNSGMRRQEMAEKYGLPVGQIKKACDMAGLKNIKPKSDKFIFEDDTIQPTSYEVREDAPSDVQ